MMIELNNDQQISLLRHARNSIAEDLNVSIPFGEQEFDDEIFKEKCGAFVTLHINGSLRGCIGQIIGQKDIPNTIYEMAKSSAFCDPRFRAVSPGEFEEIDIEISILTPIETVKDVSEIKVGRDGLIISKGFNSGLLLPQVPVEQGWDLKTFLTHTCFKAGLPGDSWRDKDTKIEKFSAQVFGEKELGLL